MMARRVKKHHAVTVQATNDQLARWQDCGRKYKRDAPAFLAFAGDLFARYLRQVFLERSRPDPTLFRWEEKRRLEALVRAAKGCIRYLPARFFNPHDAAWHDPAKDLRVAVDAVESYWQENGEAWGI